MSLPHLFVAVWVVTLLWGERWVFQSAVKACQWESWESWPKEATPHHLVFLADPQLIDPHSYPGRPWLLEKATIAHTDNYLKRSYISLQERLHPDTIFFLGDLFDGGREWKTAHGNTKDPSWANGQRPSGEQALLETWGKRYGEDFWLHEYDRFGRIFFKFWNLAGPNAGPWQRGRRIISTLPGNHDLGFGANIKIPIRNRFEVYFGEGNRVDVIGNHTFVSIDAVSLSAGDDEHGTKEITNPVENFLKNVQATKRKAVARELRFLSGGPEGSQQKHAVEDLEKVDFKIPTLDPGPGGAELPTVLLTHVPLYRPPGTPCGPKREHWPPATPPKGQDTPVFPDHRNAISVSKGYQYQNVLSESNSIKLISEIGNVVSVYSGDDHDYCELVHPENKNHARETTVKSMSWAMGVRKPGFLLLSMWNPIGTDGTSLHSTPTGQVQTTTQSYLCLLPDQLGIFIRYGVLIVLTILALLIRSILTPILHLTPFSLPPQQSEDDTILPMTSKSDSKRREEDSTSSTSSNHFSSAPVLAPRSSAARTRSVSPARGNGYGLPQAQGRYTTPPLINAAGYNASYTPPSFDEDFSSKNGNGSRAYNNNKPKTSAPDTPLKLVFREAWQSVWRVTWVTVLVYCWLAYFG